MPRKPSADNRWGGRRPGAGAPLGNINAMKRGFHSKQLKAFAAALAAIPETRAMLLRLSKMEADRRAFLADALSYYAAIIREPPGRRIIKNFGRPANPTAARKGQTPRKQCVNQAQRSHPEPVEGPHV